MSTDSTPQPIPGPTPGPAATPAALPAADAPKPAPAAREVGGPKGPEPTRYGDWEQKGRCTDF